jgi:tetratricopeptide (TPR) repeat protein/predicted Ser/Thr protein kinase
MIGKTILHYKILEQIGKGGMGVVYKAEDTKLKREVAIKFLPRHIAADSEERERFKIEAQAAAALNHNNIATIHNIEETEDEMFIVMEYIEGQELKDKIAAGALPVEEVLRISSQISSGLQAAHSKGIVHRDIKSANIMLTKDGQVKVMDFGLAKISGGRMVTKAGTTLGTAAYMSPEQTRGQEVDSRTDIWSLGVIMYEMLTGQLPFQGEYEQAMSYAILNEDQASLTSIKSDIPVDLERIVNKCLQKDPSDRYQHVDELMVDLRQLKKESDTQEWISRTGVSVSRQKKKTPLIIAGAAAAVVVLIIAGYFFFGGEVEPAGGNRISIAVADFVNQTKDEELNGLSGMLITSLEQSRRLRVLTRSRMFDILEKMGEKNVDVIDEAVVRRICQYGKVGVLVTASIRKFGKLYTIDMKMIDPSSNEFLLTAKEEGEGKESIPGMLDRLSEKTRKGLKEKESEYLANSRKVEEVTTPNLDAYYYFFLGEQYMNRLDLEKAQEAYRQAIAIDSSFGLAYFRLAYTINWFTGNENLAQEPLKKALDRIDRIPEKEQYLLRALDADIEKGHAASMHILREMEKVYPDDKEMIYEIGDLAYHMSLFETSEKYLNKVLEIDPNHERALEHLSWLYRDTERFDKMQEIVSRLEQVNEREALSTMGAYYRQMGQFEKAIKTYDKILKTEPDNPIALHDLINTYRDSRQFDKALQVGEKLLAKNSIPLVYTDLHWVYRMQGDLSNAQGILEAGLQSFPNNLSLLTNQGYTYIDSGEFDKATAHFKSMASENDNSRMRRGGLQGLINLSLNQGKYADMVEYGDKLLQVYQEEEDSSAFVNWTAIMVDNEYLLQKNKEKALAGIRKINSYLPIRDDDVNGNLAFLYANIGDIKKAESLLQQIRQFGWKEFLEAFLLYKKGKWDESIAGFAKIVHSDPRWQAGPLYYSALCYKELGDDEKAISRLKDLLASYGFVTSYYQPQALLLLGKLYETQNNTQLAMENYQKFLKIWKNADADLPDLIDAKERLAKLKGVL